MERLQVQLDILEQWFAGRDKVLVALSGGVDSCLVAFLARKFLGKEAAIAVISNSASLKAADLDDAKRFCETHDIQIRLVDAREIEDPNYASNPNNRCYFCKSALYDTLGTLAKVNYPGFEVLNGNNFSDFGDYRPGLEAAEEFKVLSPLADCKMNKEDIRAMARHFDLSTWDKPASPCLSSRFPYGESITREKLRQVEDGEIILNEYGFNDVRVRHFGEEARLEVPSPEVDRLNSLLPLIKPQILALGFAECKVDEEGLVSGKLNRALEDVR